MISDGESALSLLRRISSNAADLCCEVDILGERLRTGEVAGFGGIAANTVAGTIVGSALATGRRALIIDCIHSPALTASLWASGGPKTANNVVLVECWDPLALGVALAGLRLRAARAVVNIVLVAGLTAFYHTEPQPSNYESYLAKLAENVAAAVTGTGAVGMWTAPAWNTSPRSAERRADIVVEASTDKSAVSSGLGVAKVFRLNHGICREHRFSISSEGALQLYPTNKNKDSPRVS